MNAMLGKLDELLAAIGSSGDESKAAEEDQAGGGQPAPAAKPAGPPDVGKKHGEIAAAIKALDGSVKSQASRLAGLEKRSGLPNSRTPEEPPRGRGKVSWPSDINKPLDRDSVDKSVSFHD